MNIERINQKGSVILTKWKAEREAARVSNQTQYITSSDPAVMDLFGSIPSASGYSVNDESAMRVSAVAACVQLLGGTIASLPLNIYRRTAEGREKIDSPLWYILNEQPCPSWTAASMFEWFIRCNTLRGDAFGNIQKNRVGDITGIVPLHPDRVYPLNIDNELVYHYRPRVGPEQTFLDDQILHIPGFGYDGDTGRSMSVIKHAAFSSIGIALAADDFSGKLYANGAMPKHLFKSEGKLSDEQIAQIRKTYADKYTGPENVGLPMVLTQGVGVQELSMNAVDADILNSRKYQVIDIARAFGVPPHMIGANDTTSSWGTGIEQITLGFVKFTLKTYLNRIEQEINRKFFKTAKFFVEFGLEGLLSGDSKAEGESLRQAIGGSQGPGWMTPNEVRRIKNLPPVEGGDELYDPNKGNQNAQEATATAAG